MKRLFLLFAALCCMATMQAEIVHHAKCDPTYMTVGYTQECWEDTENGNKLYAEEDCTTELNRAVVVTYKKLRKNPYISESDYFREALEKDGSHFDWAVETDLSMPGMDVPPRENTFEFKVYGSDVSNARVKWWTNIENYSTYTREQIKINFYINNELFVELPMEEIIGRKGRLNALETIPLPELREGDDVKIYLYIKGVGIGFNFAACLEYTSVNGGDPDVAAIKTDDKRKFIGVDDPELTYNIHYPSSSTEEITGIILSRDQGNTPGFYTIHASQAEGANPNYEIIFFDGKLEIVDGVYHAQGETRSDELIYLQDCWEETATGKFYADDYLEHELKPESVIGYPQLPFSPVTATDDFTVKESATYDDAPFDWAAETTYEQDVYGERTVEFTVTEPNKSNNARLAWYISTDAGFTYGHIAYTIYKNDGIVEDYFQPNNKSFARGLYFVQLPDLKMGDKIKFKFHWRDGIYTPTVAACLQYITPQELCLKAQEAGSTVELKRNGATNPVKIQYSTDYSNWTTVDFSSATTTGTITLANVGDRVYFRKADEGVASGFSNSDYQYSFAMTGKIAAGGNVMSLIDNTCEATNIPSEDCFAKLFYDCESLTSAPRLPAKTLKKDCYWAMFFGCKNLTTAPELPATTLAEGCYTAMFSGCTSLATAPVLPATTLKAYCYLGMFTDCTSLTTAPELPVTTLAVSCYASMFRGCANLTAAPLLPATTMAEGCYRYMFSGCTKLESAPELKATNLANKCYSYMFEGCTSLTTAPELPATALTYECYRGMFKDCTGLQSAPALEAPTLNMLCYQGMFEGCTSLTAAPELPATTLERECYENMFSGCTNLKSAPALPATEMSMECYLGMFAGCTSLTTAPELPAKVLNTHCYERMFEGCTSLTTAPELPATTLKYKCYERMFYGCEKLNHIKVGCTSWMHDADPNSASYKTTTDWLNGVAETGTFVCPEELDKTMTGASYIPEGWSVMAPNTITISCSSSDESKGMVSGGGTYMKGDKVTLTAKPAEGYVFEKWSDGTTANPYVFTATKDVTLTAQFAKSYTVQVTSADESKGTVSGGGTFEEGTEVTLTATPAEGYIFKQWSDGTTENPYVFNATKDVTLTAQFAKNYTVQVSSADESKGTVSGGGTYEEGTNVTLTATPAENYEFEKWSDGTTANPYVFTATKDVTITALFTEVSRYITDGTEYTATESKFLPEVIYTRTFNNTDWQALYVPFSMNYDEWSEKYEIAKIHNFIEYDDDDNGEFDRTYLVVLRLTSGSTKPNYPYLIRAKETGTHSLVLQDKTLEAAEITSIDCRSVENEYTFTGTYTPIEDMYDNGYYAMSDGALKKANTASVKLNPQRWYMDLTSRTGGSASTKAQSIRILVDGEEGIRTPSNSPEGGEPVAYDLMGRAVSTATNVRGITISNGKKVIR